MHKNPEDKPAACCIALHHVSESHESCLLLLLRGWDLLTSSCIKDNKPVEL